MKPLWDSYAAMSAGARVSHQSTWLAAAPKIGNIPRKIVIPDDIGDEIHVDTCADLARGHFPAMEALHLGPRSARVNGFCVSMTSEWHQTKLFPDAVLPGMPEDVGEFHHVRSRVEK